MSLSDVPTLPGLLISLSATNCKAGGIINFCPCKAIVKFLSSTNVEIEISESSKEVSFRSVNEEGLLLSVPPPPRG